MLQVETYEWTIPLLKDLFSIKKCASHDIVSQDERDEWQRVEDERQISTAELRR